MKKQALVLQIWGLGDASFTQSLVHDFINEGYDIVWPVHDHFVIWLTEAYPSIKWVPVSLMRPEMLEIKKDCDIGDIKIIPIRFAEFIMGRPYALHMVSKYEMYGKDWRDWKTHALPQRNYKKEKELKESLGIKKGMKYNFLHTKFGGKGHHSINITTNNDYPNIEMRINDGFSFYHWLGVFEDAENIFAVSSASLYMFLCLELKAHQVHIFNRTPIEPNLNYVRFLLPDNYILHE